MRRRGGQAMLEYVVVSALVIAAIGIFAVFLYTFREYGDRVLSLAGYDYP